MPSYDITVRRDGKFWFIEIPALAGATQARRLSEVDEMARDYIAEITGVDETAIILRTRYVLSPQVVERLERADQLRKQEADARSRAAVEARLAAQELKNEGLTVREIGTVLSISHQRAQQLVSSK